MSLSTLNTIPKCYKVVCNLLDNDVGVDSRNFDNLINTSNYREKIPELSEYLLGSDNIKHMVFLFVGSYNEDIKQILDKIVDYASYVSLSESDRDILHQYFSYNLEEEWDVINNPIVEKIYFIPHLIHDFDNVSYLHTLISTIITNFTKTEDDIRFRQFVDNDQIFLYTDKNLNIDYLYEQFVKNIQIMKANKGHSFDKTNIISYFKQYGISENITNNLLDKYKHDIENLQAIVDSDEIKQLFYTINDFLVLSNNIKNKRENISINTNINYLISNYSSNIADNSYKTSQNYSNELLSNISESEIIYVYTQINVQRYLTHIGYNKENIYGNIYKYLFPKSKMTDNVISKNILENYRNVIDRYEILNKYNLEFLDIYSKYNNTASEDSDIQLTSVEPLIFNVKSNLNLPNNFELLNLFNSIPLDYSIPFSKIKDIQGSNIVYKIFKPITFIEDTGYIPYVTKETLINWTKYRNYELDNFKIKNIKGNPRELFFKLLIKQEYSDKVYEGNIVKTHIYDSHTSYDIKIKGGEDIYSKIHKIDGDVKLVDTTDSSEIVEDSEVYFKKKFEIYADFEVYRKNIVNISVNTSQFQDDDTTDINTDIQYTIIEKVNQFIEILYKEDRKLTTFQKYINYFDSDKQLGQSYNNSYKLTFSNKYKLVYPNFLNILDLVYPLIHIPEEKFKTNSENSETNKRKITFYDFNSDLPINVDIIARDETNNTYTIRYKNSKGEMVEKTNILSRFLGYTDTSDKSYLTFEFKLIKSLGYDKNDKIMTFIDKCRILGLNVRESVDRIKENFDDINTEDAQQKINEFLSTTGLSSLSTSGYVNPKITIDWLSRKESDDKLSNEVSIYVENISNNNAIENVNNLIQLLFDIYNFKYHDDKTENSTDLYKFLDKHSTEDATSNKENANKVLEKADTQNIVSSTIGTSDLINIDESQNLDDLFADLNLSDDEGSPQSIDSESDNEEERKLKLEENIKKQFKDDSIIIGQNRLTKNALLDNLYNRDSTLFNWEDKLLMGNRAYTGVCQGTRRYPKVLTDEQKAAADAKDKRHFQSNKYRKMIENHPNYIYATQEQSGNYSSYNTTINDKSDCKDYKSLPSNSKCSSYRYGSTIDNQNWYMCPKIFDIKDNMPLHWTELDYIDINGHPFYPKDYNNIDLWRVDYNTGKDILDYKPTYNGRGPINQKKSRIAPTSKNSLIFLEKRSKYSYPGFLDPSKNPSSYYTPCCFNNNSKRITNAFSKGIKTLKSKNISNAYIQGIKKELGYLPKRFGLLPPEISKKLGNIDSLCTTGDISDSKKCFLRVGNKQGPDSYLSFMSDILFDSYDPSLTKDYITDMITKNEFTYINNGTLDIKFRNYGKQSSFQNFIEYTLSNEQKNYEDYFEFFSSIRLNYLRDKGNKLPEKFINYLEENDSNRDNKFCLFNIIFEVTYSRDIDNKLIPRYKVLCPYFSNTVINNLHRVSHVTLCIKNKNIFEPIYFFDGSSRPKKIFRVQHIIKNGKAQVEPENKAVSDIFQIIYKQVCNNSIPSSIIRTSQISNRRIFKKEFSLIDILNLYFYSKSLNILTESNKYSILLPKTLLVDNYNRIYGIVTINDSIIPLYPDTADIELINIFKEKFGTKKLILSLTDSNLTLVPISVHQNTYELLMTLYDKTVTTKDSLKSLLKKIEISIVYYFEDEGIATGFLSNTGSYINTKPEKLSSSNDYIIKNNYSYVDSKIKEYQEILFSTTYSKPIEFKELINIIHTMDIDVKSEFFDITHYYSNTGMVNVLITSKNVEIPIIPENIEIILKEFPEITLKAIINKISNLEEYIQNIKSMSKIVNYDIPITINGYLMNANKVIDKIILETGNTISLSSISQFKINQKNPENFQYKINTLLDSSFIEKARTKVNNLKISNRTKKVSKFNYKLKIYISQKYFIFKKLQRIDYNDIKYFISSVVNSIEFSNFAKKFAILPILKILYYNLFNRNDSEIELYPDINIENIGNTEICSSDNLNKTNNDWLSSFSKIRQGQIKEFITLGLNTIFGNIDSTKLDYIYDTMKISGDKSIENVIDNIVSELNDNDLNLLSNDAIDVFNSVQDLVSDNSCKLVIYNVDNIFDTNLLKLTDELVQNTYSKIQILDDFKIFTKGDRYKYIDNIEELFTSKELEDRNKIANLYLSIKKSYYRNILDFNEIDIESTYVADSGPKNSISKCKLTNKTESIVNISVTKTKKLKNNSKIDNKYYLNNLEFTKFARDIYHKNSNLSKIKLNPESSIYICKYKNETKKLNA